MESVNRLGSCRFEPLVDVVVPERARVWTAQQYYDGSGDKNVFLLTPTLKEVAVYAHPDRLPAFPKTWKPLLFIVNSSVITFRLTDMLCLVVTIDRSNTIKVTCVDYNGGFIASHPATNMALAYGAMAVRGFEMLPNSAVIPHISSGVGDWSFFLQFYTWGTLVLPKTVSLQRSMSLFGVAFGKNTDCLGVLLHPPNMMVFIHLNAPKVQRRLEHGKDFTMTAIKSSDTDIDIYLIMDGQLIVCGYSFDLRWNKEGSPKHIDKVIFKCVLELDDKKKFKRFDFRNTKNTTVACSQGCPSNQGDHLVSQQLIGIFDAEISTSFRLLFLRLFFLEMLSGALHACMRECTSFFLRCLRSYVSHPSSRSEVVLRLRHGRPAFGEVGKKKRCSSSSNSSSS
ncbi:hypothetical protein ACSSS7_001675 [Eimeria intestinalis]